MSNQDTIYYRQWDNEAIETKDGEKRLRLPKKIVDSLEKKSYGVYGHSGVQICSWTKKSLRGEGACYKEKFYGIECHSCMEYSPAVMWCQENCSYCWRPMEFMKNIEIKENEVDDPIEILENLFEQRKKLLSGFKGNDKVDKKKLLEAQIPSHFAISLSGEPTMYPKLNEQIKYLKTLPKTRSIFVVTNAQIPEYFEKLKEDKLAQPTHLYISIEAPDKKFFDSVNKSLHKDGWDRLMLSLKYFSELECRRLYRYTMIKGLNSSIDDLEKFKEIVEIGKPDFIEVKAYMHIGMSQGRHTKEQMPEFVEVRDFAREMCNVLGNYTYNAAAPNSRIVLLRRIDSKYVNRIEKFENER